MDLQGWTSKDLMHGKPIQHSPISEVKSQGDRIPTFVSMSSILMPDILKSDVILVEIVPSSFHQRLKILYTFISFFLGVNFWNHNSRVLKFLQTTIRELEDNLKIHEAVIQFYRFQTTILTKPSNHEHQVHQIPILESIHHYFMKERLFFIESWKITWKLELFGPTWDFFS